MSDRVTISFTDHVAEVRLSRPDKRNALDGAMFVALAKAGEQLKANATVRAVVLCGEGPSFCAGLDFASFRSLAAGGSPEEGGVDPSHVRDGQITQLGQQVAWVWQEVPVPVIAAVHGHAIGGGIQIALGADIRIVHPDTQLSVRELHWGLLPDMTGTLTLSQLVRPDVAKELVFTARHFDGREAAALGLATRLSDTPIDDARALAADIAARNPEAVRAIKALFNERLHRDAAAQFAAERDRIRPLLGSPNQVEATTAHFAGRAPVFADPPA